jgi:hypothetical protein
MLNAHKLLLECNLSRVQARARTVRGLRAAAHAARREASVDWALALAWIVMAVLLVGDPGTWWPLLATALAIAEIALRGVTGPRVGFVVVYAAITLLSLLEVGP